MVLTGRAEVYGRRIRACQACGAATKAHEPKALRRSGKPLGWQRAVVKAAGGVDELEWQIIVAFYGGLCAWCEKAPWAEQDHVQPISRGGVHLARNIVPSCHSCNQRKSTTQGRLPRRPHPFMDAPSVENVR